MKIIQIVNIKTASESVCFDAKLHQNEIKCLKIMMLLILTFDVILHQTIYQYLRVLFQLRCNFASKNALFFFRKNLTI